MEFKDIFFDLRKERGLTQPQLAKLLDVSEAVVSHWETGRNEPTLQMLKKLALFFGVSIDFLAGLEK